MTREASEDLRGELAGVQIQWLVENVWICNEADIISIAHVLGGVGRVIYGFDV